MRHPFRSLMTSRLSRAFSVPVVVLLTSLVAGCSDDPVKGDGGGGSGSSADAFKLTDSNNFTTVKSELILTTIKTQAEADLTIDWSGIQKDFQCHDVDAKADIDEVLFLQFKSTSLEEVTKKLDAGSPSSMDLVTAPFRFLPDGSTTKASLTDFDASGTFAKPSDDYKDTDNVYLLVFQNGTNIGQGARSMVVLDPGTDSNTTVKAPPNDKCDNLDFQADLQSLEKVPLKKAGPWVLDWTGVKNNSQGTTLEPAKIDRLLVGFYEGKDPAYLQEHFLDLEVIPTMSWELRVDARKADLQFATNRDNGEAFDGFDHGDGTWIMGLFCDSCSSPAPWVVTIIDPQ